MGVASSPIVNATRQEFGLNFRFAMLVILLAVCQYYLACAK